jgi:hypothetical protein
MASPDRKPRLAHAREPAAAPPLTCGFCHQGNPADAKYCNACGAPLAAVPCTHCGTTNEAGATACRTCGEPVGKAADDGMFLPLPPADAHRPEPVSPDAAWDAPMFLLDEPKSAGPDAAAPVAPSGTTPAGSKRTSPIVVIVVATLAALGAIGSLFYRSAPPDAAAPEVSVQEAAGRVQPAEPPAAPAPAPAVPAATVKAAPPSARAEPAAPPSTRNEPAAPPVKRAVVEPPASRPPAAPSLGPCTDALAALGLCIPQKKEP